MQEQTLEGLLRQYITNSINGLFTAIPARVVTVVDAGEQRVDVQPLVSRVNVDDEVLDHPVILSVPLIYPGSKSSQFSFPVERDDIVLCIFSQRSIQRFKLGAESPHRPINLSKYSRQDAMAIPGLFSFPSAVNNPSKRSLSHSTDDAVVAHNIGTGSECEVRLDDTGGITVNAASGQNVTINIGGSQILQLSESEANFDVPITAPNLTTDTGVSVNDHTHSQPSDSAGDTEAETNPPTTS